MNPYNFAVLLFAFGSFFIGLLVWFKRNDAIGRIYFVFSLFTTIWALGFAVMCNNNLSYETVLWAARIADASALFIPATWLHLVLLISGDLEHRKKMLVLVYLVSIIILCFAFTPLFIAEVKPTMNFKHWLRPGPIFHFFTAVFFTIVPYGFFVLYQKIKRSLKEEKSQLGGFLVAAGIGFLGGAITFLPNYEIAVPQYNIFLMPVYPFMTAYFLIKHRLFDVEAIAQAFQREKLATIGLIAASINHEIRNPLYTARGLLDNYLEFSREGLKQIDPKEVTERARRQIDRALEVVTKLNRFAKPATDSNPQDQKASIPEALQNVLDLVSYEFELDKIHIQDNLPQNLPLIQIDQRQLEEILFNLIVNACHAMKGKGGGELVIASRLSSPNAFIGDLDSRLKRVGMTNRRSTIHDSRITLTIQDTGTGIPPEQAKHLFEPFHTTKGEKGTGLGLYITKQLVERNGGRISVKNREGEGAEFVLEFKAL